MSVVLDALPTLGPSAYNRIYSAALREFEKCDSCEIALRAEVTALQGDRARLDWLETHPLQCEVKGGADDGNAGTFWGCGAVKGTLREAVDTLAIESAKG